VRGNVYSFPSMDAASNWRENRPELTNALAWANSPGRNISCVYCHKTRREGARFGVIPFAWGVVRRVRIPIQFVTAHLCYRCYGECEDRDTYDFLTYAAEYYFATEAEELCGELSKVPRISHHCLQRKEERDGQEKGNSEKEKATKLQK
jgi:hypothetical protein